jgi:hypothetical protein
MRSWRENPDGAENTKATKQNEREIGALKLQAQSDEIACPNCYGGHFRPCQWCGDTGRVTLERELRLGSAILQAKVVMEETKMSDGLVAASASREASNGGSLHPVAVPSGLNR